MQKSRGEVNRSLASQISAHFMELVSLRIFLKQKKLYIIAFSFSKHDNKCSISVLAHCMATF